MPRKKPRLGQHFLKDGRLARRIVEAAGIRADDLVIEIGPGHGAMTRVLARQCARLVAIELDPALAARLAADFHDEATVEIIRADILQADLPGLLTARGFERCFVFGNLPYYITSPILQRMFGFHRSIRAMATVVQLEVAERITAQAGGRHYGYLSILATLYSSPRLLMRIPPGAFSPPPAVRSGLVVYPMALRFPSWNDMVQHAFLDFVKRSFANKRKNLLNNLSALRPRADLEITLEKLGLAVTARAEEVPIDGLARLFEALAGR